VKASNRQRLEGHLLAPGVPLPRSVWSNKIKIADDLGVPVPELEYLQAIRHDASWVVRLRGSEMNRCASRKLVRSSRCKSGPSKE
jgi:hypothetical protein